MIIFLHYICKQMPSRCDSQSSLQSKWSHPLAPLFINNTAEIFVLLLLRWNITFIWSTPVIRKVSPTTEAANNTAWLQTKLPKQRFSLVYKLPGQEENCLFWNLFQQDPENLSLLKSTLKNKKKNLPLGRRQVKHHSFLYSFPLLPCFTDNCFISFFCFQERPF